MRTIEENREYERGKLTELIERMFERHRAIDKGDSVLRCGDALIFRTKERGYLIYGVDNTLYFSSTSTDRYSDNLHLWFPGFIAAARAEGIAPCMTRGFTQPYHAR